MLSDQLVVELKVLSLDGKLHVVGLTVVADFQVVDEGVGKLTGLAADDGYSKLLEDQLDLSLPLFDRFIIFQAAQHFVLC